VTKNVPFIAGAGAALPIGSNPADFEPAGFFRRHQVPGLHLTVLDRSSCRELHATLTPLTGESIRELIRRLVAVLKEHRAVVVRQFVFGAIGAHAETLPFRVGGVADVSVQGVGWS